MYDKETSIQYCQIRFGNPQIKYNLIYFFVRKMDNVHNKLDIFTSKMFLQKPS